MLNVNINTGYFEIGPANKAYHLCFLSLHPDSISLSTFIFVYNIQAITKHLVLIVDIMPIDKLNQIS